MYKKCLLIAAAVLSLSSCIVMIWDIAPVVVYKEVVNGEGQNLFDEATPGNWLGETITAVFEDEEYIYPSSGPTRAYAPQMYGLTVSEYGENIAVLYFGELDGEESRESDLVISWPDGSEDTITVKRIFRWKITGKPDGRTTLKLNGRKTGNPVRIVKK